MWSKFYKAGEDSHDCDKESWVSYQRDGRIWHGYWRRRGICHKVRKGIPGNRNIINNSLELQKLWNVWWCYQVSGWLGYHHSSWTTLKYHTFLKLWKVNMTSPSLPPYTCAIQRVCHKHRQPQLQTRIPSGSVSPTCFNLLPICCFTLMLGLRMLSRQGKINPYF